MMRNKDGRRTHDRFSEPQVKALLNGPIRGDLHLKVLRQFGRKDFLVGRYPRTIYRGRPATPADLDPTYT